MWCFICDTRRFPAVGSGEVNSLDESGQRGRVEPCLCTTGHTGHRPCLLGRCIFRSCWAHRTGYRSNPSMARLVLQAGLGLFATVPGRARAGPNHVGHVDMDNDHGADGVGGGAEGK
jgi:hypothetical protein